MESSNIKVSFCKLVLDHFTSLHENNCWIIMFVESCCWMIHVFIQL
uniref:Uncharacterized protein n=1 Tax=Rhizophora mucronata TaxID=61149 RepID=A0A2P2LB94_RHIMU